MCEREEFEVDHRAVPRKKWTCRDEVWAAFIRLEQRTGRVEFRLCEVVSEVRAVTRRYRKDYIGKEISSRMCANAPINHAVCYPDLERVGRGLYRRCIAAWSPRPAPQDPTGILNAEFHQAMVQLWHRCERDLHFTPTWLRKMLPRVGGVETARRYVCTTATETELEQLWRAGCLDESVEALMLHPRFAGQFTDTERRKAQQRLNRYRDYPGGNRSGNRRGPKKPHNPTRPRPWPDIVAEYGD
jgi:hypothetical protein